MPKLTPVRPKRRVRTTVLREVVMRCDCCKSEFRISLLRGPRSYTPEGRGGWGWTPARWYCPCCSSAEKVREQ